MGWFSVQTAWLEKRTLAKAARVFPQRRLIPCASGRPVRCSPAIVRGRSSRGASNVGHPTACGRVILRDVTGIAGARRERSETQRVEKRTAADELARVLCKELYEFIDGWPMEWRKPVGGARMHIWL
jgi:hypothetical protein